MPYPKEPPCQTVAHVFSPLAERAETTCSEEIRTLHITRDALELAENCGSSLHVFRFLHYPTWSRLFSKARALVGLAHSLRGSGTH